MNSYIHEHALEMLAAGIERIEDNADTVERRRITLLETHVFEKLLFLKNQILEIGYARIMDIRCEKRMKIVKALFSLFPVSLKTANEWGKTEDICLFCLRGELSSVQFTLDMLDIKYNVLIGGW